MQQSKLIWNIDNFFLIHRTMLNIFVFFFFFCRVLKPPGGGTSDIFGGAVPNTPRSTKNRMVSNIFSAPSDLKNGNGKLTEYAF